MVSSDPSALINAVLCTVIVMALMLYRRQDYRHRPFVSFLAYIYVIVYANVPFRYVFGLYQESHWLVVIGNLIICIVVLYFRGNLARIVDEIFNSILGKEGGYVDHPDDKGGPTKWGITQNTARAHGYRGDMRDLTREQALEILEADYWYGPRFDQVAALSSDIAAELCDTGVNMGPTVASKMLQRWLNVFNLRGKLYPRTINALRAYLGNRGKDGERVMLTSLNCTQGERYLELAEKREANESFVYGWMKERVVV